MNITHRPPIVCPPPPNFHPPIFVNENGKFPVVHLNVKTATSRTRLLELSDVQVGLWGQPSSATNRTREFNKILVLPNVLLLLQVT